MRGTGGSLRCGEVYYPCFLMSVPIEPSPILPGDSPATPAGPELAKQYRPAEYEPGVWDAWLEAKAFHANPARVLSGERQPYCVLIPPPNVTAALHLGHALNNTLQDILVRTHRMRGFETLWMPGTDHAGIATQAVVEKRVMKDEKKRRTDFGRDEFIAKIQSFKDEYEAIIINQLKKMGCSCDWDRQRFTMDDICVGAVREAFFRLFHDELIYRGKRLVNWDPALATAVADDECYDEEVASAFYYLRYPLVAAGANGIAAGAKAIAAGAKAVAEGEEPATPVTWGELASRGYPGAADHPSASPAWVTVATTRPETYLGDTAVALSPHDPRAAALRGLRAQLPLVGRVIPIIEDSYVVLPKALARSEEERNDPKASFATGFLKVTPAHDVNDYEIGRRHGLDIINIMSPDGRVSDSHGWSDVGGASAFLGKKMAEARKSVVEAFKQLSLLEDVKAYSHSVKHSDRSKAVIEPYLSDQWYVKVTDERLAPAANNALVPQQRKSGGGQPSQSHDGSMSFFPDRYAKTFEGWHDNIRDWCISRQLWWGHRIPVWRTTTAATTQEFASKLTRLAAENRVSILRSGLASADDARESTRVALDIETVLQPTAIHGEANVTAPTQAEYFICVRHASDIEAINYLESAGYVQDSDVLDTWFSSALWPMSTMGWPTPDVRTYGLLQAFNPSSTLCTAREIITLWVSRMTMFNRYFMGEGSGHGPVPFRHVFIHAVIQDGEGRKMSKSLGNGVDPLDIIESHGADAMRYALCNMATNTQDVRLPVVKDSKSGKNTSPKFDAGRNFANKIWNAARFTLGLVGPTANWAPGEVLNAKPVAADSLMLSSARDLPSAWMLARLARAVHRVDTAIANYEFSDYAQALYDLVWRDFCDWYLEAIKPTVAADKSQRDALGNILSAILRLLHPVMPFMTEALWRNVSTLTPSPIDGLHLHPSRSAELLCNAGWPQLSGDLANISISESPTPAELDFSRIQHLATALREARATRAVAPRRKITLHVTPSELPFFRIHESLFAVFCTLAAITSDSPPANAFQITIDRQSFALSDLFDPSEQTSDAAGDGTAEVNDAERSLLLKRLAELDKEISTYEARLSNPGYAVKAPPSMVQETMAKLEKCRAERPAIVEKLG